MIFLSFSFYVKSIIEFPTVWKSRLNQRATITVFTENSTFFRQINVYTTKVTKELISRKFLSVIAFYNIQLFTKWTGRNEIITSRDGKILTARDGNDSYLK